eukprot:CAMPEP_0168340156 /NCGR_PEP_ID=MMETSP0213-20121227/13892_1 /TAXON_ID=151035 /ORGANISM="Euplotes harpa, Strain FSP1.4" /LENGTH=116 /DNA_ID=CAMNT_0008346331 /DNA_START=1067 /DNA_END=1418 /DNA_ORIENTATION=-
MPENIASLLQLGHFNLVLEQNLRLPVQSPSLCEEHLLEPLLPLEALPLGFASATLSLLFGAKDLSLRALHVQKRVAEVLQVWVLLDLAQLDAADAFTKRDELLAVVHVVFYLDFDF